MSDKPLAELVREIKQAMQDVADLYAARATFGERMNACQAHASAAHALVAYAQAAENQATVFAGHLEGAQERALEAEKRAEEAERHRDAAIACAASEKRRADAADRNVGERLVHLDLLEREVAARKRHDALNVEPGIILREKRIAELEKEAEKAWDVADCFKKRAEVRQQPRERSLADPTGRDARRPMTTHEQFTEAMGLLYDLHLAAISDSAKFCGVPGCVSCTTLWGICDAFADAECRIDDTIIHAGKDVGKSHDDCRAALRKECGL